MNNYFDEYLCEIAYLYAGLDNKIDVDDFTVEKKILLYKHIYDIANKNNVQSALLQNIYSIMRSEVIMEVILKEYMENVLS